MLVLGVRPAATSADDGLDLAIGLVVIAAAAFIYVIPTIVAIARKSTNLTRIVLVNILLGWTIHGWIAALAMALRSGGAKAAVKPTAPQPIVNGSIAKTVAAKPQAIKRSKSANPFAVERDCPRCAARIPMMAPVCPACGADLYAQVPSR